jgi:hypothetical protein
MVDGNVVSLAQQLEENWRSHFLVGCEVVVPADHSPREHGSSNFRTTVPQQGLLSRYRLLYLDLPCHLPLSQPLVEGSRYLHI